jgi:hypothetical protein
LVGQGMKLQEILSEQLWEYLNLKISIFTFVVNMNSERKKEALISTIQYKEDK